MSDDHDAHIPFLTYFYVAIHMGYTDVIRTRTWLHALCILLGLLIFSSLNVHYVHILCLLWNIEKIGFYQSPVAVKTIWIHICIRIPGSICLKDFTNGNDLSWIPDLAYFLVKQVPLQTKLMRTLSWKCSLMITSITHNWINGIVN